MPRMICASVPVGFGALGLDAAGDFAGACANAAAEIAAAANAIKSRRMAKLYPSARRSALGANGAPGLKPRALRCAVGPERAPMPHEPPPRRRRRRHADRDPARAEQNDDDVPERPLVIKEGE